MVCKWLTLVTTNFAVTLPTLLRSNQENSFANYKDNRHKAAKISDWQIRFIWWLRLKGVTPSDISKAVELPIWSVENVIYKRGRYLERIS